MTLLKVRKTNFRGNPNVGLYLYVTDEVCLAGMEVPDEELAHLEETFGVPVHRITLAGTGLLGVFLAGYGKKLLVPGIIFDRELKALQKLGFEVHIIDTTFTALGNNILCNAHGLLVSMDYTPAERKQIEEALGLPSKALGISAEITVIGSAALATERGCLIHRAAQDFEVEMVSSTLQVPVTRGTVSMGSGFVKSGIAANDHGMVVGDTSGGPEIVNAEEALRGEE
jgi:translation initiation factor 6